MTDVKEYCDNMGVVLSSWKDGIYDILDVVEAFPETDKKLMNTQLDCLRTMVADITGKIDQLKNSCPVDFGAVAAELQRQVAELRKNVSVMWDLEHIAGGYVGG